MEGTIVSHYRVLKKLGGGGMSVIYLAEDTRLGRRVALKFLPENFGAGRQETERLFRERLQREARSASALNHPNICVIYDVGEFKGQPFIAMEHLQGEDLKAHIKRRPLETRELIDLALQTVDGLAAAHAQEIVHRDIKPSNIFVTPDNRIKILDFGLAKLQRPTSQEEQEETTATHELLTSPGSAIGTVAYMSPEQALGRELDARTDLFSLGVVLYEMATGALPFRGSTAAAVFDRLLNKPPVRPSAINPKVPPELERIILKALEKDCEVRYQSALDLRADLRRLKRDLESGSTPAAAGPAMQGRGRIWRQRTLFLAAAAILLVVISAWAWFRESLRHVPTMADLPPMQTVPFTHFPGRETTPAFSPDGNQVAYAWNGPNQDDFELYVQLVDGGDPLRLTDHPGYDGTPAWSPNGRRIAYMRYSADEKAIYEVPALGGRHRKLHTLTELHARPDVDALSWSPDGRTIVFTDKPSGHEPRSLYLLSVDSLQVTRLTEPPAALAGAWDGDWHPAFSPDGKTIAFIRSSEAVQRSGDGIGWHDIYLVPAAGGEPSRLTFVGSFILGLTWTPNGREIVFSSGREDDMHLWRVALSGGAPQRLGGLGGEDASAVSAAKRGNLLAFVQVTENANIWCLETGAQGGEASPPRPLITSTRIDSAPQYSPDESRIAFESTRSGFNEIWLASADGSGETQLTFFNGPHTGTPRWSPDGRFVAFDSRPGSSSDIFTISADGGEPLQLTDDPANDVVPSWSRDGKWVYFGSNRSGENQIWKVPSQGGEAVQVTRNGGFAAYESLQGDVLYYTKWPDAPGTIWCLPTMGGEEVQVIDSLDRDSWGYWAVSSQGIYFLAQGATPPRTISFYDFKTRRSSTVAVLPDKPASNLSDSGISVSADGRRLLYTQTDQLQSDIMVVENFR